jgi:cysteinyl-tRNA synthetase
VDAISRLLADRYHAKKQRNFEAADCIRDDLSARYNVSIDDRSNEWRVDTNDYARRRSPGDGEDVGGDGGGGGTGPAETLSEGEARYIDGRLKERFDLKRARLYGEADAIRDELMDRFGVQIDDRTKEWFVVVAGEAEDAALSPA